MKGTLVLYNRGTRKVMEKKYGKDCTFLNVRFQGRDSLQGLRFKSIKYEDEVSIDYVNLIAENFLIREDDWDKWSERSDAFVKMACL